MDKLLLIDKDGTIVSPKSGDRFVQTPWDQQPISGATEAIDRYVANGWMPVIISNQAGIAAGHKSLEDTIAEMRFCLELFPAIQEAYFCPDFEGWDCWRVWGNCDEAHRIKYDADWQIVHEPGLVGKFRKPNPGMLLLAIEHRVTGEVLYVGDRPEDEGAAEAAGVEFIPAHLWRGDVQI